MYRKNSCAFFRQIKCGQREDESQRLPVSVVQPSQLNHFNRTLWVWSTPATTGASSYLLVGVFSFLKSGLVCWSMVSFLRRKHRWLFFFWGGGVVTVPDWAFPVTGENKTNKGSQDGQATEKQRLLCPESCLRHNILGKASVTLCTTRQIAGLRQDGDGVGVPYNHLITHLVLCRNVNSECEHLRSTSSNGDFQRHVCYYNNKIKQILITPQP